MREPNSANNTYNRGFRIEILFIHVKKINFVGTVQVEKRPCIKPAGRCNMRIAIRTIIRDRKVLENLNLIFSYFC